MKGTTHLLFSYGTLQLEKVQIENYGRTLKGERDRLIGYKTEKIQITDTTVLAKSQLEHHPIAVKSAHESDFIEGMLFEITNTELAETDNYEVSEYHRILETFESGKKAWVYVGKNMTL
ncbi:AIG2 family protein [Allomuricauda ruestringensis DSM 13258]|uniref:AIG2 family protein n=1 Tax=Allomuricauda ruestringensis (strain DSM 13258 / CIP 107369 / LMG 19739 / B1) TaxID=886377 RepID=G2PIQ0_ALLRU|nr:gamma-glutamylcyclotransferase family protein [Allomuricauda ruestringensis]AEM71795.1 AIG2 family protein [Allomuricauda ruestringensis DSM 13258]